MCIKDGVIGRVGGGRGCRHLPTYPRRYFCPTLLNISLSLYHSIARHDLEAAIAKLDDNINFRFLVPQKQPRTEKMDLQLLYQMEYADE